MMYRVRASLTLQADNAGMALQNAGIAIEHWNLETRETDIQGVGCPEGQVEVSKEGRNSRNTYSTPGRQ